MRPSSPGLVVLVSLLPLAASCRTPRDATPTIHVDPRAAGRLAWLSHPADAPVPAARVHVMKAGEELGGPNAVGQPGDLVLENDEVAFVIDRLGSSSGFAESGGNVVDAADAHARKDELGQQFTYFGTFPRQGVYGALTSGTSNATSADGSDQSAWVEASGVELYEPELLVTTRYTLHAPDRALLLETTLENRSDHRIEGLSLGDAIQWGGAEKVAPGKARGFKGPSSGPYVGGVGRFTSYAVTSIEGKVDANSGSTWTDTALRSGVSIEPGAKTTYARILVVGERPDTASLVSELALNAGQAVGAVRVRLLPAESDAGGEGPVDVPPDAKLVLQDATAAEVMTLHAAGSPPALEGLLPAGHYVLSYAGGGGRAGRAPAAIDVVAGGETRADLMVTRPAGLRVRCADEGGAPMACKVTFERMDGAPAPDFGPAHAAGPARNQATTADGDVHVPLASGAYRVTASRGPEYTLATTDVRLAPGDETEVRLAPRRVLDTSGYLGCDFHQHTMLGADAPVSKHDRVVSNAAEGVEVAVATEHNVVASLEPIVRELHLESELVSIAGDELTSDASRHPWGHANAWPLPIGADDLARPRGGAPAVRDRSPRQVFDGIRAAATRAGADVVVQINHPRSGRNGYFDQLGFDRATGLAKDPGYDARFDALEVWNGRNVDARAEVLGDFFALLRTGRPVTPTADTDTHGIIGQEAGYPRTYVRVADDAHLAAWDSSRTADLVRGVKVLRDVVLTNGPMLRVSAEGAPIGGVARGHAVHLKVHVETAPWVTVDEVRVLRASSFVEEQAARVRSAGSAGSAGAGETAAAARAPLQRITSRANAAGALVADVSFVLRAPTDDAFIVVASGQKPMTPVFGPPVAGGDIGGAAEGLDATAPFAMTGAIWIDADSDGKALGR